MEEPSVAHKVSDLLNQAYFLEDFPNAGMLYCRMALECIAHSKFFDIYGEYPSSEEFQSFHKVMDKIGPKLNSQTKSTMFSINAQARENLHWSMDTDGGQQGKYRHVKGVIHQLQIVVEDIIGVKLTIANPRITQEKSAESIINESIQKSTQSASVNNYQPDSMHSDEIIFIEATVDAANEFTEKGLSLNATQEFDLGKLSFITGDYDASKKHLRSAKTLFSELADWDNVVQCLLQEADIHDIFYDAESEKDLVEEAVFISQAHNLTLSYAKSMKDLGSIKRRQKMYDEARRLYNKALEIYEEFDDKGGISAIFHNLGIIEADCKSYVSAKEFYMKSFELDKIRDDDMGMYSSYNQLGRLARYTKEFEESISLHNAALEIAKKLNYRNGIARSYSNLSMTYDKIGQHNLSKELAEKAIQIRNEIGLKRQAINGEIRIANSCISEEKYSEALNILKPLISRISVEFSAQSEQELLSRVHSRLGLVYFNTNDHLSSLQHFQTALAIDEELSKDYWIAIDHRKIGRVFEKLNDYANAKDHYLEGLKFAEKVQDLEEMSLMYTDLGDIHCAEENFDDGIDAYKKALDCDKKLGTNSYIRHDLLRIGKTYYKINELNDARDFFQRLISSARADGDLLYLAKGLQCAGFVDYAEDDFNKAIEFLSESNKLFLELNDTGYILHTLLWLGQSHLKNSDMEAARRIADEALGLAIRNENNAYIYWSTSLQGGIHKELGETDTAIQVFNKCLDIAKSAERNDLIIDANVDLARCHAALGDINQSNKLLRHSIKISQEKSLQNEERVATHQLAMNLHESKRYEESEPLLRRALELFSKTWTSIPEWYVERGYTDYEEQWGYPPSDV